MIRAVTLDAAGTLIAPREPVGETYARVARGFGLVAQPDVVDARFRRAFTGAPPLAFPDTPADDVPRRERAWWRAVVGESLGLDAGAPALDACVDTLFAHYARAAAWRVYPDVAPALAALRAGGVALAVVSNFDGRLPALLRDLGLAASFAAIVWSTRVGAAKPAAAIFAAAADALGVPVATMLHVGDDPDADVRGARDAGARSLLLDRRSPAAAIPDLGAVATLVAAGTG